jgi:hypothetical protein
MEILLSRDIPLIPYMPTDLFEKNENDSLERPGDLADSIFSPYLNLLWHCCPSLSL